MPEFTRAPLRENGCGNGIAGPFSSLSPSMTGGHLDLSAPLL
jgi:hypothetical protein